MLGISFSEFIIILIAAFLIVGPKKLAESANEIGLWIGKIKEEITHFKQTRLNGLDASTLYEPETELDKPLEDLKKNSP